MHGYDNIAANAPLVSSRMLPATETRTSVATLRDLLVARDYQEVVSYSFVDRQWETDFCANADPVMLANPIASNLNAMRSSLIGSLVDCLKLNVSRQQERVRIFESGRCYFRDAGGRLYGARGAWRIGIWGCGCRAMGCRQAQSRFLRCEIRCRNADRRSEGPVRGRRAPGFTSGKKRQNYAGRSACRLAGRTCIHACSRSMNYLLHQ